MTDRTRYERTTDPTSYQLGTTPHVWGIGPSTGTKLMLIGEAPGADEIHKLNDCNKPILEPFIGMAGSTLTKAMSAAGIYRPSVYLTNVITVRPPNNDIKSPSALEAIKAEKEEFWSEVKWAIKELGVEVIVALGQTAAKALGLDGAISKIRGSMFELNLNWQSPPVDHKMEACDAVVIPTYHPSYIAQRGRWMDRGQGKADLYLTFVEDLKRALELSIEGYTRPTENFNIFPTLDDLKAFHDEAIKPSSLVAVDIETFGGLNRDDAKISVVGMSLDGESGLCLPFRAQYDMPYWMEHLLPEVNELLRSILQNAKLIFQNALFDVPFLIAKGYPVNFDNILHDTMILHHILNPELPHNLAFITSIYGATPYWKDVLADRNVHTQLLPDDELRTYNMRDCVVLHQVLPKLLAELDTHPPSLREVYENESMKLIKPITKMMLKGVGYDKNYHRKWKKELEQRIGEIEQDLRISASLPENFNLGSSGDLGMLLFGVVPKAYHAHKDAELKREGTAIRKKLLGYRALIEGTKPFTLPTGFRYPRTPKTGAPQTDHEARTRLLIALQERIALIDKFKNPTPAHDEEKSVYLEQIKWLSLFAELSKLQKLTSTYGKFSTGRDGRIHSSFLIHGTATGRLSSRGPNLQNPPRDPSFRKVFVADEGKLLLSADFSNLEVGTMAYESGDPTLIKAFEDRINIHDLNTEQLFGITKDDPSWKMRRDVAKIRQFAGQYGASENRIYQTIMFQVPECGLTRGQFKEMNDRDRQMKPVFYRWKDETMREAVKTRRTETFMGRIRHLYGNVYDIGKEALNTPCQGAAAHIINRAMIRIDERLEKELPYAELILQVHDELIFEVPSAMIGELARIVKEEMTRPIDWKGRTVTFPIELDAGPSLGELTPYKEN